MFTRIKRSVAKLIMLMGFMAVLTGLMGLSPSYAGGDSITIESVSYAETSASAEVKSVVRAEIEGATQVTWQKPNHNVKVTKKELRKAPRIKVNATGANSSKVIFKKAKGAEVVILKQGSCVRNTGKENRLRVGFVWCLKHNAVLVLDKSRQYRHAFNLIGGKLVKTCLNFIGGKVPMREKVVQVRYKLDIVEEIELEGEVNVSATAKASKQCPTGTLYGEATATASASASVWLRAKIRERIEAVNAKKLELLTKLRGDARIYAKAKAVAKITLTCSDNPPPPPTHDECPNIPGDQPDGYNCNPPPPYQCPPGTTWEDKDGDGKQEEGECMPPEEEQPPPTFMQFREINDVYVNATTDHCVTVDFPSGHSGTVYWTATYGSFATPSKSAQDAVQVCSSYKAPSEVPSGGTDTITVTATDSVTGKSVTKSTQPFVIKAMPATP